MTVRLDSTEVAHAGEGLEAPAATLAMTPKTPQLEATGPGGHLRRAHLSVQRCADAVFSGRDATTDQYALMRIVRRWEGIRQNQLATELFADASTVTAMLRLLESRGLVRRVVCSDDGRARRVYLTRSGATLLDQLAADWEPYRQRVLSLFASDAGQEALRILDRVRDEMVKTRIEITKRPVFKKSIRVKTKKAIRA